MSKLSTRWNKKSWS